MRDIRTYFIHEDDRNAVNQSLEARGRVKGYGKQARSYYLHYRLLSNFHFHNLFSNRFFSPFRSSSWVSSSTQPASRTLIALPPRVDMWAFVILKRASACRSSFTRERSAERVVKSSRRCSCQISQPTVRERWWVKGKKGMRGVRSNDTHSRTFLYCRRVYFHLRLLARFRSLLGLCLFPT